MSLLLGPYFMDLDHLKINWGQIHRAADGMIANHGEDAVAVAEGRAQAMRSAGRHAAAVTWDCICESIKNRIGP